MHNYPKDRGQLPNDVKQTSGGTFDPNASQTYFIASSPDFTSAAGYPNVLVAVNELTNKENIDILRKMADKGVKVMLDSGIFNLAMEHARKYNVTHDQALSLAPEEIDGFDQLWERYAQLATEFKDDLWGVVELDQGGVQNKPRTRERIEKELGFTPIPVYHPLLDGWAYYDDLAKGYDRICFGNIVQSSPSLRVRLVHTAMERARQYPYLWTHLLGLSQSPEVLGLRYRGSLDSSSWLSPIRWHYSHSSKSMGQNITVFDKEMWSHTGSYFEGVPNNVRSKGIAISSWKARSEQQVFNSVLEDTHKDYTGREVR